MLNFHLLQLSTCSFPATTVFGGERGGEREGEREGGGVCVVQTRQILPEMDMEQEISLGMDIFKQDKFPLNMFESQVLYTWQMHSKVDNFQCIC